MKKLLPRLTVVGLLVLALGGTAGAKPPTLAGLATAVAGTTLSTTGLGWAAPADRVSPTVTAITPAAGPNDIDTPVTISGAGFATDVTGTVVLTSPTASLGTTALTNVTFVNSTTLTATVPWGLNPGVYPLTVVNPDGGTGSLAGAFTVTPGIGQWNAGDLFGGQMQQLLMKPSDPNTLYATAYGVIGLFRSNDAGEHWTLVSDKVWANNNKIAVDPMHPDRLYVFAPNGLMRSQDKGDTWTTLKDNKWPDGRATQSPQVYVSPYDDATHPQALFVSSYESYGNPGTGALGLIKSTDGGSNWTIVPSLEGVSVQDIAFDPNDHSHVVLVASDMKVYTSTDWGGTWTQVATSGLTPSSLGLGGSITYNPGGSEVWIDSFPQQSGGGIYKSAATDLTSWQDVSPSPGQGSSMLTFTSAGSVYVPRFHSSNGGTSWSPFGPSPWYGGGWVMFDPTNPNVCYIGNDAVGVQKTINCGDPTPTWQNKVQGLTAMRCTSLTVSQIDPLRVYGAFYGPLGIYRSVDGTSHWTFLPIAGSMNVRQVLADPLDAHRVYVGADSGFYTSPDGGVSWPGTGGWNLPPSSPSGLFVTMAADPYQAGHLLASFGGGTYGVGPGWLYSSSDYGASWQAVTVNPDSGVQWIRCIAFDPGTPGTVYLTTNGVYKSTDHGATWQRIDDQRQPDMATADSITIATHPQHLLFVGASSSGPPYRSLDGGATWQRTQNWPGPSSFMFADRDSPRLYAASWQGLYVSSDAGDSWQRAAGVLGQVQTTAMGYADADGHTILYAATNGGQAGTASSTAARAARASRATAGTLVRAGIYRFVQLPAPAISSFTPTSGTVGAIVTLTGTRFTGATAVAFNGTPAATFSAASDTRITATVPSGATSGAITVTTPGGSANSATSFTVVVTPRVTLKLSGLKKGAIKLGKRVTVTGKVTPATLAGSKVRITVQKKKGAKWVKVKTVSATIRATSAYSWKYKPAKRGAYRLQVTIAKAATHGAATTKWLSFKVK